MSDKTPAAIAVMDEYLAFLQALSKTVSQVRDSMADGDAAKTEALAKCWDEHQRKASEIELKLRQAMLYDAAVIMDKRMGRNN